MPDDLLPVCHKTSPASRGNSYLDVKHLYSSLVYRPFIFSDPISLYHSCHGVCRQSYVKLEQSLPVTVYDQQYEWDATGVGHEVGSISTCFIHMLLPQMNAADVIQRSHPNGRKLAWVQ